MVSLILLSVIVYKTVSKGTSFIKIIILLAQIPLTQSSQQLTTTSKARISSIIIFLIWIMCSRVLSLSFTSLLLRTYNTRIESLTVETLEEIVSEHQLSVVGSRALNEIKLYKVLKLVFTTHREVYNFVGPPTPRLRPRESPKMPMDLQPMLGQTMWLQTMGGQFMGPQSREPKPMGPEPRKINNIPLYESLGIVFYEAFFPIFRPDFTCTLYCRWY